MRTIHAFVIPSPSVYINTTEEGAQLPLPDPLPAGRLVLRQKFTFDQRRDVGTYADHLWRGVCDLVDGVLAVMEASQLRLEEALPVDEAEWMRGLRQGYMPRPNRASYG